MIEQPQDRARLIAFYLPQFHPIPENDMWWGKGFTEWTNVSRARPLFRGHYQPRIPADLGYYDLRVPEVRAAQADLARDHGLEGFCYWHYWFAGKRLLQRPFEEVLNSGEPNYPFCLGWANQSWTGTWHGAPDRVLIEQTYPGMDDDETHFYTVLDSFTDHRYLTIEGKPIFVIFAPWNLPDPERFTDNWRELAIKAGLRGVYFMGLGKPLWNPELEGFDASILSNLTRIFRETRKSTRSFLDRVSRRLTTYDLRDIKRKVMAQPEIYQYADAIKHATPPLSEEFVQYPSVIPNWDHTPRTGTQGVVLHNSTPDLFRQHLRTALVQISDRKLERRIVFLKSWNEWAEGNYLEPDIRFGKGYLQVTKSEILDG